MSFIGKFFFPEETKSVYVEDGKFIVKKNLTKQQRNQLVPLEISEPPPYGRAENRFSNRRGKIVSLVYVSKERAKKIQEEKAKMNAENAAYREEGIRKIEEEQRQREKLLRELQEKERKKATMASKGVYGTTRGGKRRNQRSNQKTRKITRNQRKN